MLFLSLVVLICPRWTLNLQCQTIGQKRQDYFLDVQQKTNIYIKQSCHFNWHVAPSREHLSVDLNWVIGRTSGLGQARCETQELHQFTQHPVHTSRTTQTRTCLPTWNHDEWSQAGPEASRTKNVTSALFHAHVQIDQAPVEMSGAPRWRRGWCGAHLSAAGITLRGDVRSC